MTSDVDAPYNSYTYIKTYPSPQGCATRIGFKQFKYKYPRRYEQHSEWVSGMGDSPGDVKWRTCDVGEAKEGLEN